MNASERWYAFGDRVVLIGALAVLVAMLMGWIG